MVRAERLALHPEKKLALTDTVCDSFQANLANTVENSTLYIFKSRMKPQNSLVNTIISLGPVVKRYYYA